MSGCSLLHFLGLALVLILLAISSPSLQQDTIFDFSSPSEVLNATGGRIRGARNRNRKNFVLGGLFPIHTAADGGGACGAIRQKGGLERMEAMLYAIDTINADERLLKGLTLGYDIRDTCSSENIGLDETVDLVITSSQLDIESCRAGSMSVVNVTVEDNFLDAPTSGIVGASSSSVSVPVASLVRLFTTPQVSYASSSAILSNRDRYSYFFRTVPPDNLQARAMIDLLEYFNWTYISTIYSQDTYGEPGVEELRTLASQKGICIDLNEGIDDDFSDEKFAGLAEKLVKSQANVVILFASQEDAVNLLKHFERISSRKFTWIASDSWARSVATNTVAGMIGFVPLTENLPSFHEYFSSLTLNSNIRNPWFEEFYSVVSNCTTNESSQALCNRNSSIPNQVRGYKQGKKVPLVIDAVYTYAYALDNFLAENCEQPVQWFSNNRTCLNQTRELNGSALLEYIQKVNFDSVTGNSIFFDSQGNVEGRYEILNLQVDENGGSNNFVFNTLGMWNGSMANDSSQTFLQLSPLANFQFGLDNVSKRVLTTPPESQCGRCSPGQFRRQVQSSCCGFCVPCLGEFFSNNPLALNCSKCEKESWGNDPMKGSNSCVPLKQSFLSYSHPFSIIIIIIAIVGLVAVVFTLAVFAIHWKTPVVKSSGREQMILLLLGITLSFISAFFFVSPPQAVICGIQRWILWTSFAVMFGALLVKIVRVARIFLQKGKLIRPRFTQPQYQVLFTVALILVQWVILVISTSVDHPQVVRETRRNLDMQNAFPTLIITCLKERIVFLVLSLGYETFLIALCTIFGALSFTYPDNFNEAKYIALCSISILVIWIAFIITFFATQSMQELQNIAISLAVVMSGYAVLLSIFGQKLFVILFKPEQNTRNWSKHNGAGASMKVTNSQSVDSAAQSQKVLETLVPVSGNGWKPPVISTSSFISDKKKVEEEQVACPSPESDHKSYTVTKKHAM